MAPIQKSYSKKRGAKGGRGPAGKPKFSSARTLEPESADLNGEHDDFESESDASIDLEGEEEESQKPAVRAYNALLQSFQATSSNDKHRKKRRKVEHQPTQPQADELETSPLLLDDPGEAEAAAAEDAEEAEALNVDDEEDDLSDPFEAHFSNPDEKELNEKVKAAKANQWQNQKAPAPGKANMTVFVPGSKEVKQPKRVSSAAGLKLKKRLASPAKNLLSEFNSMEQSIVPHVFNYQDLLFGDRTLQNAERLRRIVCLHALNHVFKTRDKVIKNNAKLAKEPDSDLDLRDQGFTRPKVLVLLETRNYCAKMVDEIVSLCEPEQQENKKRFQDAFVDPDHILPEDRPEDFRQLFEGNDDNEFRIGLKFTRKTIKFFSQFYTSDIIFASPLGLRRVIEHSDPKKRDSDFLSSIELVIMDQTDAMLMQNWEHLQFVFEHLNQQPKESHGCDFSRVRNWYLDGNAAFLRQTIILSGYITPELITLFNHNMKNIEGKVKYQPHYDGAIEKINMSVKQTFSRFASHSPVDDPDARFKYFTTAIVPSLSRYPKPAEGGQGILIIVPTYIEFVRVRNYFAASTATENISFGAISEYTEPAEMRRARAHFLSGRHSVLLYTSRAHHFKRYSLRGVRRVIMYAPPDNPLFYQEYTAGFLGMTVAEGKADPGDISVRVMFSKFDALRLERIVGTERVKKMVKDKAGDTFDFV